MKSITYGEKVVQIPTMLPIKKVVELTGFSYWMLRQMCLENRIPYIKAGKKYLINMDKFAEYLNTGDTNVLSQEPDKEAFDLV